MIVSPEYYLMGNTQLYYQPKISEDKISVTKWNFNYALTALSRRRF